MNKPLLLHLYDEKSYYTPDETILKSLTVESQRYDPIHLLEFNPHVLVLECVSVTMISIQNIKTALELGKSFIIVILSNAEEVEFTRELSLLTQCVSFPIPNDDEDNSRLNYRIFPMIHAHLNRHNYIETLKIRSHGSTLVDSLNVVAHQWRQPINLISMESINLSIQSTLQPCVPSESIQQSTQIISEQSQRMADILKSVLNMGKTHRGREPFSINEMMERIKLFFFDQLRKNSIEFKIFKLSDDLRLQGYQTDLEEVLVNLIANAKEALNSSSTDRKKIYFETIRTSDSVVFSVRDNAGKIPDEIRERIFEPHFSTKGKGEGFGIGLHVARMIVEQEFKGSLILSNDDEDTLFRVDIPLDERNQLTFINT